MLTVLLSSIVVFVSTSIDYIIILVLMFKQKRLKKHLLSVVTGVYLGTFTLVTLSLVAAYGLKLIPEEWIIGLLGLIPIGIGIRAALKSEKEDEDDDELNQKLKKSQPSKLIVLVALVSIASGGDNVGVYIPYFSSLTNTQIITAIIVFIVGTAALCYAGYRLTRIRYISETLERYERIIVPVVYITLGLYIMIESGTIMHFL